MKVRMRAFNDNGTKWGNGHETQESERRRVLMAGFHPLDPDTLTVGEHAQRPHSECVPIETLTGGRYWLRVELEDGEY